MPQTLPDQHAKKQRADARAGVPSGLSRHLLRSRVWRRAWSPAHQGQRRGRRVPPAARTGPRPTEAPRALGQHQCHGLSPAGTSSTEAGHGHSPVSFAAARPLHPCLSGPGVGTGPADPSPRLVLTVGGWRRCVGAAHRQRCRARPSRGRGASGSVRGSHGPAPDPHRREEAAPGSHSSARA